MIYKILVFSLCFLMLISATGCKSQQKVLYETVSSNHVATQNPSDATISTNVQNSDDKTSANTHSTLSKSSKPSVSSDDPSSSKILVSYLGDEFQNSSTTDEPKTYIEPPSLKNAYKLNNSMQILKSGEALKVVYFGTSVTTGSSWSPYVTNYLKTLGKVNDVNSSLGGAGSYAGIARFENDVIAKNPDLVFIELAINDKYRGFSQEESKKNLEYMIRKLYEKNPYADVVIVLVTDKGSFGKQYDSCLAHKEVADHYKIPCVDFGIGLYNLVKGSKDEVSKYLQDMVHPNKSGYKVYADVMKSALKELMIEGGKKKHTLPKSLEKNNYSTVTNFTCTNNEQLKSLNSSNWSIASWNSNTIYEKEGCQFRTKDIKTIFPKYIFPTKLGISFTFKFTGDSICMLGSIKDKAGINVILDGKDSRTVGGTTLAEVIEYPLFTNLEKREHTLTVEIIGTQPYVAIAGFVVTK